MKINAKKLLAIFNFDPIKTFSASPKNADSNWKWTYSLKDSDDNSFGKVVVDYPSNRENKETYIELLKSNKIRVRKSAVSTKKLLLCKYYINFIEYEEHFATIKDNEIWTYKSENKTSTAIYTNSQTQLDYPHFIVKDHSFGSYKITYKSPTNLHESNIMQFEKVRDQMINDIIANNFATVEDVKEREVSHINELYSLKNDEIEDFLNKLIRKLKDVTKNLKVDILQQITDYKINNFVIIFRDNKYPKKEVNRYIEKIKLINFLYNDLQIEPLRKLTYLSDKDFSVIYEYDENHLRASLIVEALRLNRDILNISNPAFLNVSFEIFDGYGWKTGSEFALIKNLFVKHFKEDTCAFNNLIAFIKNNEKNFEVYAYIKKRKKNETNKRGLRIIRKIYK